MKGSGKSVKGKSKPASTTSNLSSITQQKAGANKRKADDVDASERPVKRLATDSNDVLAIPSAAAASVNESGMDADVPPLMPLRSASTDVPSACSMDCDEPDAVKQRIADIDAEAERVGEPFQARTANDEIPKTPLEQKLAAELAAVKSQIAEEEAGRERRRRKTPAGRIHIPPNLHPFLLPLCVGKEPSGPLFVSERKTADGEEKRPDQDTMLKLLRAAAKRAGLEDWVLRCFDLTCVCLCLLCLPVFDV